MKPLFVLSLIATTSDLISLNAHAGRGCYELASQHSCQRDEVRVFAQISQRSDPKFYCLDPESVWMVRTAEFQHYYFDSNGVATEAFYKKQTTTCPDSALPCMNIPLEASAADSLYIMCNSDQ